MARLLDGGYRFKSDTGHGACIESEMEMRKLITLIVSIPDYDYYDVRKPEGVKSVCRAIEKAIDNNTDLTAWDVTLSDVPTTSEESTRG